MNKNLERWLSMGLLLLGLILLLGSVYSIFWNREVELPRGMRLTEATPAGLNADPLLAEIGTFEMQSDAIYKLQSENLQKASTTNPQGRVDPFHAQIKERVDEEEALLEETQPLIVKSAFRLLGVVGTNGRYVAVLQDTSEKNSYIVKEKEVVKGERVVRITDQSVTLDVFGKLFELTLLPN